MKRILTIQDISCLGQCSLTVALPIISACGVETCVLPSAVLSTHTGGFKGYTFRDLTEDMPLIEAHWNKENITFDAVYTGYLGSAKQIAYVKSIYSSCKTDEAVLIVDPAMADHGKLYRGFDEAYAEAMKELCTHADIMLPNITEAAMMSGLPFREELDEAYVRELLNALPGKDVLMTGVGFAADQTGFALKTKGQIAFSHHPRVGKSYHGTGDLFAAAFVGALASGKAAMEAGKIASEFTLHAIENTFRNPAHWYGVKFETALPYLMKLLNLN